MQKECEICGTFFETPTKIRKYCDDCLAHQKRNMGDVYFAQKRTRGYMPEKVNNYVCHTCGKKFKSTSKLVFKVSAGATFGDGTEHFFCSNKCENDFRREHSKCRVCGKSLRDNPYFDMRDWHTWYCSNACKEKERWDTARLEGRVHSCLRCGKEFISKEGKFCSKECYRAAVDEVWTPGDTVTAPKTIQRRVECPVCHKKWIKTYTGNFKDSDLTKPVVCSQKCAKVFGERLAKKLAEKKRQVDLFQKEQETEKGAFKVKDEADLCATCRVPYKECVRMQSEFRVLPDGARYNEKGKLVTCPSYRNTKKTVNPQEPVSSVPEPATPEKSSQQDAPDSLDKIRTLLEDYDPKRAGTVKKGILLDSIHKIIMGGK